MREAISVLMLGFTIAVILEMLAKTGEKQMEGLACGAGVFLWCSATGHTPIA